MAGAPYDAWLSMWRLGVSGQVAQAAVMIAPAAVPLGLLAGGLAWAVRIYRMETGTGGLSPGSAISFDRRQWRRQARSARARIAAPGSVPLTYRNGDVVIGGTIRAVRHPAKPIAAVPYARLRSHQVVIGTTGTGKTTLLLRLWAGFMATALSRQAAGAGRRPLLVVLDCKGGADSRRIADRSRRVLRDAGARADGDLAGRREPVAVGPAAGTADHHPARPDRARARRGGLLHRRDGGDRGAGRARAARPAGRLGGFPAAGSTLTGSRPPTPAEMRTRSRRCVPAPT